MNNGATAQIEALTLLCLLRSSSTQWDPTTAKIGLQRVVGAGDALADGSVAGEHLRHLNLIKDNDQAAEFLALAPSQSPDDFAKTVTQYLIDRDAKGVRERQQRARSVKFFKADNGCVGVRVILAPVEGEQVKATLNEVCDAMWRATHPERAEILGGHRR